MLRRDKWLAKQGADYEADLRRMTDCRDCFVLTVENDMLYDDNQALIAFMGAMSYYMHYEMREHKAWDELPDFVKREIDSNVSSSTRTREIMEECEATKGWTKEALDAE